MKLEQLLFLLEIVAVHLLVGSAILFLTDSALNKIRNTLQTQGVDGKTLSTIMAIQHVLNTVCKVVLKILIFVLVAIGLLFYRMRT